MRRFDFACWKQRTTATAALISRAIEGRAYDRKAWGWQVQAPPMPKRPQGEPERIRLLNILISPVFRRGAL